MTRKKVTVSKWLQHEVINLSELDYQELEDRKKFYLTLSWVKMREQIKRRDNYECQWCKEKGKMTIDTGQLNRNGRKRNTLIVHHIEELKDRPDLKLDENNLITVCFECHERHHNRWRDNHKRKKNKWTHDEKW